MTSALGFFFSAARRKSRKLPCNPSERPCHIRREAEVDLRKHIALGGRLLKPFRGFGVILLQPSEFVVHRADIIERVDIALLGQRLHQLQSERIIAFLVGGIASS